MRKLKPLMAVAFVGVVAVAMSGCWAMSGYSLSKTKLAPGPAKKSVSKVTVNSHVTSSDREYFFIFTAVGVESGLNFSSSGKFDVKRKFGNKPKNLIVNNVIREEIISDGNCGPFELSDFENPINEGKYKVLATSKQFQNGGISNKQAVSKLKVRQTALSAIGDDGAPDAVPDTISDALIAVGSWEDADNDGNVDGGEGFGCGGGTITELNTKFED